MNPRKLVFLSNSASFLLTYKLSLSELAIKHNFEVDWWLPSETDMKLTQEQIKSINVSVLPSKRGLSCLFHFTASIFKALRAKEQRIFVSHTAYINVSAMAAFLPYKKQSHRLFIFISGFGPSRIRNSLRYRLVGRIYLSLLRIASKKDGIFIVTLNEDDHRLVCDYRFARTHKILLVRESGVSSSDVKLGQITLINRAQRISPKIKVGYTE